jgi:molybdopterin-guanine dinucleotide biosynthesis protein A
MDKALRVGPISAVILAGGGSTRLGQNKALLKANGQTLIERIIYRLAQVSEEIIIATNDVDRYEHLEATVVADVYPGKAALGGIHAGLQAVRSTHSIVVGCDMPFLSVSLLRYMQTLAPGHDVVIPRVAQYMEALHAIYAKSCIPHIERQLEANDLQITSLLSAVRVRYVEQEEIDVFDPDHLSFFNINSQADLEKAREIWTKEAAGSRAKAVLTSTASPS